MLQKYKYPEGVCVCVGVCWHLFASYCVCVCVCLLHSSVDFAAWQEKKKTSWPSSLDDFSEFGQKLIKGHKTFTFKVFKRSCSQKSFINPYSSRVKLWKVCLRGLRVKVDKL